MKSRIYLLTMLVIISCSDNYTPKPRGLFKLELPKKLIVPPAVPIPKVVPEEGKIVSTRKLLAINITF